MWRRVAFFYFAAMCLLAPVGAAGVSTNEPAVVKVSGFGFLGNREMRRLLRDFEGNGKMPSVIDRTFVEDAALLLLSRANEEGYLNGALDASFEMMDGSRQSYAWTDILDATVTNTFAARSAHFRLQRGVRFYYKRISFEGLEAIPEREARNYFVASDVLLRLRRNRIYNPAALTSSLSALREAYARAGYQDAVVSTNKLTCDASSGQVVLEVKVVEGLPTIVRSVVVEVYNEAQKTTNVMETLSPHRPYSRLWQQELSRQLQAAQYAKGFPDATVKLSKLGSAATSTNIQINLQARVDPGPLIKLGKVLFHGNKHTKRAVLQSRVKLQEGKPLDRIEAERARQRLARLGVFDSVRLDYESVSNDERNVMFNLEEAKPISLSLLAGFGSYDLLRGGLEFQDRDVFGLAHSIRFRALQSFKSTQGELLYNVPEAFGENVDLFLQGSGLRREEVSFTRKEYGGSLGFQKRITPIKTDLSLRYDYEFLNALNVESTSTNLTGVDEARSAAFVLELNRDRREPPLLPEKGLRLFGRLEFASAALGGNVDYQRLFLGASYHIDLRGGRLLHMNLVQGMSFTFGGSPDELPFNKRFFPGGENSVRGYQEGEASPLDEDGNQLGAETFTQGNIEFEQLLTKTWSVVTFFDAVGFAKDRSDYPWDEGLYSVGLGIRWRTLIGPVRLEYGYNLNPREHDPTGTLHFSIGAAF